VGHGFQNILIARELRRRGWYGPRLPDHRPGMPTGFRRGWPVDSVDNACGQLV
jgi:hypothetical protein